MRNRNLHYNKNMDNKQRNKIIRQLFAKHAEANGTPIPAGDLIPCYVDGRRTVFKTFQDHSRVIWENVLKELPSQRIRGFEMWEGTSPRGRSMFGIKRYSA